jgi:hypothetical protein
MGNMIITRKEIFDEYCSWLFSLLFELEQRIDISSYNAYQARIWGFLSERLLRVWLMEHTWRICELPFTQQELVKGYDTLGIKKTELMYRQVSLLMEGIVRQYQQEAPDMATLSQPAPGEKIPVWICWWQGIDATPDLVTLCIQSALNHLPQDLVDIHLITLENYQQYVTFPDYIVQKFNEGKISYAHLSDILRVSLLSAYGGLWLDATYYLAKDFPREILTGNVLYTLRLAAPPWEADIVQGRWSGNLILAPKGNRLCQFLLGSLYYYWRTKDTLIDYYLIDYLIALAYDNFSDIRSQIDACPYSDPHVLDLQRELNRPYEKSKFESYLEDTGIFKLNHRFTPEAQTPDGRPTLYGTLIAREFGLTP